MLIQIYVFLYYTFFIIGIDDYMLMKNIIFATIAKYIGVPIEMISELLGHKSIKTTQIYLASFNASELAKMNKKVCNYIGI